MAYVAEGIGGTTPIILIVLENANGDLRFLVDPDWRALVQAEDREYFESLLADFPERAKEQPATLFKQLTSLEVGPLVTQEAGEQISDHPPLLKLSARFVQL